MKTLAELGKHQFALLKNNQIKHRASTGLLWRRNRGFIWRKIWRLCWEIIEVAAFCFALSPSAFKHLWAVPLISFLVNMVGQGIFQAERVLLERGHQSIALRQMFLFMLLSWIITLFLLADEIQFLWNKYDWVRWYLGIKGITIFLRHCLAQFTLAVTARTRPYFPYIILPMTLFICCLLSILITQRYDQWELLFALLVVWGSGQLVPEILFLHRILRLRRLPWFQQNFQGKRIAFSLLAETLFPWLIISMSPFIIVKTWPTSGRASSVITVVGTATLFFIVERWVLRGWRSWQLDAKRWHANQWLKEQRVKTLNQITLISFFVCLGILVLPWLRYQRVPLETAIPMGFEIILFILWSHLVLTRQVLNPEMPPVRLMVWASYLIALGIMFYYPWVGLGGRSLLLLAEYYNHRKHQAPLYRTPKAGTAVFVLKLNKRHTIQDIGLLIGENRLVVLKNANDELIKIPITQIEQVEEAIWPIPCDEHWLLQHGQWEDPKSLKLKELLTGKVRKSVLIWGGRLGELDDCPIYRMRSGMGERYFRVTKNIQEVENKLRAAWYTV